MNKVYVASSWRNENHPVVCQALEDLGLDVYNFRKPNGETGFGWQDAGLDPGQYGVTLPQVYLEALDNPQAVVGFNRDMTALDAADIVILVLPCERDAHLELGYAVGAGKKTIILLNNPVKPSLMYKMVDHISPHLGELLAFLSVMPLKRDWPVS